MLLDQHGVSTFEMLDEWLSKTPAKRPAARSFFVQRADRLELSDSPGVYRMLDCRGRTLYIGKAASLRRRVNGHFYSSRRLPERNQELLSQVHRIDAVELPTALEAALEEYDSIRSERPPYNVAMNEDEGPLWFYSANLSTRRTTPSPRHCLGPLTRPSEIEVLRELRRPNPRARLVLPVPSRLLPDHGVFRDACDGFRQRYLAGRNPLTSAARLWAERLRQAGEESAESEGEADSGGTWRKWDGPDIDRYLRGVLARAGSLLRRARFMAWLSEAEISFFSPRAGAARHLGIEAGRIVRKGSLKSLDSCPVPGRWHKTLLERLRSFDQDVLGRMRVLVTELRRLVAAERQVVVVLAPRKRLDRQALARLLRWF
ncbi:MAG: nucleotide excision repair endonuclease [Deltaproteobacteria bacterium]|nr:MAG: nucleotide excision repair endonuclease [Deltaproteobacteria bacterium]